MMPITVDHPRVTICLLAYQHEQYIGHALECLLVQTNPSFKVIAIDDGSTDQTYSILKEYESGPLYGRMEVLTHPGRQNHGIYAGYRCCLRNLDTEFFMAHASDDFLYPHAIEYLIGLMDSQPSADFLYGPCQLVSSTGDELGDCDGIEDIGSSVRAFCTLLRRNPVREPTMLLRAHCKRVILDDHSSCIYGDWLHNLILFSRHNSYFYDSPVVAYRHHEANVSRPSDISVHLARYRQVLTHALASIPSLISSDLEPLVLLAGCSLRQLPAGWPSEKLVIKAVRPTLARYNWDTLNRLIGPEFFDFLPPRLAVILILRSPLRIWINLIASYLRRQPSIPRRAIFLSSFLTRLLFASNENRSPA